MMTPDEAWMHWTLHQALICSQQDEKTAVENAECISPLSWLCFFVFSDPHGLYIFHNIHDKPIMFRLTTDKVGCYQQLPHTVDFEYFVFQVAVVIWRGLRNASEKPC